MKIQPPLLGLLALLLLAGCTPTETVREQAPPPPPSVTLLGDDDEKATTAIAAFFKSQGYDFEGVDEDTLLLHYDDGHFLIQPKITVDSIDRLVVTKAYGVVEGYRGSFESLALVTAMNRRFNIGQFSLSDSGDTLYIQSYYTFDDEIVGPRLEKFLKWMDEGIGMMLVAMPEIGEFLE